MQENELGQIPTDIILPEMLEVCRDLLICFDVRRKCIGAEGSTEPCASLIEPENLFQNLAVGYAHGSGCR